MNTENDSIILERKGVRPTANRILILRTMLAADHPVSLPELEDIMETMDKSSIFRVLNVFVKHHVAHECTLDDMHIHFYCEVCHRTFCFKTIHVPGIDLPGGFTVNSINYMAKGICPECSGK